MHKHGTPTTKVSLGELAELVRQSWEKLTPPLDARSLDILKAIIESEEPLSLYKVSKSLGLSFSVVYKKGRLLEQYRLIQPVGKSAYTSTVKACVAGYVRGVLDAGGLASCVASRWPLKSHGVSVEEALSMLYALGIIMRARGLDLVKATICGFDEASMHVFKVYLASVVAQSYITSDVKALIEEVASRWKAPPRVVAAAFRAAVKGVLAFVPPTIVTPSHRILLVLHSGAPRVVAVDCRRGRCRHYEEEVGLTCPVILAEAASAVAPKASGGVPAVGE